MLKMIASVFAAGFAFFIGYVATRNGKFKYGRDGLIQAPAKDIFPYLSNLRFSGEWNPFERADPGIQRTFSGPEGQAGSVMDFSGSSFAAPSGRLELLKVIPDELVRIRLVMTKPIKADNIVEYRLTPEQTGTRFSWTMEGDSGFMGKLMSVVMNSQKMMGNEFSAGIQTLKELVEAKKSGKKASSA